MSIDTEFFGGQPPRWVSGTTYPLDFIVRSPASQHYYVRIIAGAGTTDPSADPTNWARTGAGGARSIQRVDILIASGADTATATISSVTVGRTRLKHLGSYTVGGGPFNTENLMSIPELTNSTTVTVRRFGTASSQLRTVVEIEETW
jgi:hypothetical protein